VQKGKTRLAPTFIDSSNEKWTRGKPRIHLVTLENLKAGKAFGHGWLSAASVEGDFDKAITTVVG
jgi:hypothetical protein